MRLYEQRTVIQFFRRYPDAEHSLLAWLKEIKDARYENPAQLRQRHGSADFFIDDKVCFNIGGNKYRLVAMIRYANLQAKPPLNGMVFILFLGTHREYDKIDIANL
jgi:mRNA interferase HigB